MSFVSAKFALFLAAVLALYWLLPRRAAVQNALITAASAVFYCLSGPVYIVFLLISVLCTYLCPLLEARTTSARGRKALFLMFLAVDLGGLVVFKYAEFFSELFCAMLGAIGLSLPVLDLGLAAPLGISFYTFQSLGYLIDTHRGSVEPERNLLTYSAFVVFFPQLLAGPIGRARDLLPQYRTARTPTLAAMADGGSRFLLGLFKKALVADWLAVYIDLAYSSPASQTGPVVLLAILLYNLRIYFDFSGYSDMAIGCGIALGIKLPENFRAPYLATDMAVFWKRWHISLTSWLQDYIFTPLVWSRWANKLAFGKRFEERAPAVLVNIIIVFLLSGLWHGAGITFLIWGLIHGAVRCLEELLRRSRKRRKKLSGQGKLLGRAKVCLICAAAHVFFSSDSVSHALVIFASVLNGGFGVGEFVSSAVATVSAGSAWFNWLTVAVVVIGIAWLALLDVFSASAAADPNPLSRLSFAQRQAANLLMAAAIVCFGRFGSSSFVYFKF